MKRRYQTRRLRQFLSPHVKRGETAFDIGANVGQWTAVMRDLGARVIAVEPQAEVADTLRRRFSGDPGVEVVQSAVGDAPGRGLLHPAATASTHASMSDAWRKVAAEHRGIPADDWLDAVEVVVTTVDALIEEFGTPEFCKVDVEGLEFQVLAGLSRPLQGLAFEFHRETLPELERCLGRLGELGEYRFRVFLDEWPDPHGGELQLQAVSDRVASLPPGSWGMIAARRIS
ncbi:MAG: FkbM family methyltransferase [Actinomycetota bacterium]|nr:FkbM family methyltransferase [Actinomycetota bacterium]